MGSRDNSAANPTPPPAAAAAAASPQAVAQGPHPAAPPFPGRRSAPQAFYLHGAAAATPFYTNPGASSYHWLGQAGDRNPFLQHMMSPYTIPIAYSPMYPHGAVFPPHPTMSADLVYIATVEAERRAVEANKNLEGLGKQITNEDASNSYSESKGSSDAREESTNMPIEKTSSEAFGDGESSQHIVAMQCARTATESSYSGRKLPIQAPRRAVLHNSGIECNAEEAFAWNAPDTAAISSAANFIPTSAAASMVGLEENLSGHPWMKDDRELKKERRKQSNRESARRSRIKKQQECGDLERRVGELNNENSALTCELDQLNKCCEGLEKENSSLEKEMIGRYGPDILSVLCCNNAGHLIDTK